MNTSRQTPFKSLALFLCLISIGWAYGQKESRTYSETFTVTSDAVLDINTSHADIEFETWNKDQVSIEAVIEIEGATLEEAENYFEKGSFEIVGNSQKVNISTKDKTSWLRSNNDDFHFSHGNDFHFEIADIPEIEPFLLELPEIAELPELPFIPHIQFDYQAYKEDGEEYLKKWQKEFEKGFGKDYEEKMEDWAKKLEIKQKEMEERRKERMKELEKHQEERTKKMEELAEKRAKRMEERAEEREKRMEAMQKHKATMISRQSGNNIIISTDDDSDEPSIFYFSSDGENKNFKVKKTIKIKMPKGMKIKMNVRHGEVKLAENTKNMNATLSHSSLWATTIDGDKTTIMASYSPVSVQKWNFGQLQADYSERVNLKEVLNLRLNATSSNVTIDNLVRTAFIKNNFGPLKINSVSKDFIDLDISLQNAELDCKMPGTAFTVYVNGTSSSLSTPASFKLDKTQNHTNIIHKGYHISKNDKKSLIINSKYSEVTLH